MGSPVSQIAKPMAQEGQGKGGAPIQQLPQPADQPTGKSGRITYPGQSGQPQMGQPNNYSNTVGPWDNASIGNQRPQAFGAAKGKGA